MADPHVLVFLHRSPHAIFFFSANMFPVLALGRGARLGRKGKERKGFFCKFLLHFLNRIHCAPFVVC